MVRTSSRPPRRPPLPRRRRRGWSGRLSRRNRCPPQRAAAAQRRSPRFRRSRSQSFSHGSRAHCGQVGCSGGLRSDPYYYYPSGRDIRSLQNMVQGRRLAHKYVVVKQAAGTHDGGNTAPTSSPLEEEVHRLHHSPNHAQGKYSTAETKEKFESPAQRGS